MTFEELKEDDIKKFNEQFGELKLKAQKSLKYLESDFFQELSNEILKAKVRPLVRALLMMQVQKLLEPIILFHEPKSIKKIGKITLPTDCRRWFIPFENIKKEIEKINNEGLIYLPFSYAMPFIHDYLVLKMGFDYRLCFLQTKKQKDASKALIKAINGFTKRKKYSSSTVSRNNFNQLMNELFGELDDEFIELMKEMMLGDVEKRFLGPLFREEMIVKNNAKQSDILRLLFPLLKLIIKDQELLDEDEFLFKKGNKYRNYRIYQANRVRKILNAPSLISEKQKKATEKKQNSKPTANQVNKAFFDSL